MHTKTFLFSIDLEDIRLRMTNGTSYKARVPATIELYLKWLNRHNAKCTFFTNADVAELYPSLISEIAQEGHEIACHTSYHIPIDKQTPDELRKDIENNISVLLKVGAKKIEGFRAPLFSLTEKTKWAHEILAELDFIYSSSVLPAKNPFYGWESFGSAPKKVNQKILEIPMTVGGFGSFNVPLVGGVYFRIVPEFLIHQLVKRNIARGLPVLSYFHPYDVDTEQESFMHPGINDSFFYNFLMNYNRKNVFSRLDSLMAHGLQISTYSDFVKTVS